ncbi:transglutaminase TgpA family protein [Dyella koreensis]|uniref:transglutaminase TgpA family protein n=1 Tax=Dyella koreensis TaxID=311235 RepID=UPI003607BEE8
MIRLRRTPRNEIPLDGRAFDLLCLTAAVVLGLHASHLPPWLSAALATVLGLRWWQRRRQRGRAPIYLKLPLVALLAATVIFHYGNIFGREPGSALAVGLLVLKLLETETPRDAKVAVGFACFTLMAALLSDQGMVATFIVGLGLVPALATLRALQPARVAASLPRELLPGLGLLAAAIPLSLLGFVLVPRLDSPLWGAPPSAQARTGLSDRMSPGDFVDLLTDDHPAMRVSFDQALPAPAQRYFRAYVMTHYDGRRWTTMPNGQSPAPLEATESQSYRITLEPNGQQVLPALDVPLEAPPQARLGANREVVGGKPVQDPLTYSLHSAVRYRFQPTLDDATRRRSLLLPAGFNPRSLALATQWRERYGDHDDAIVKAALSLFHDGGFNYTLAPAPLGRDAVDDFLFATHEGFCEHYSSAFTVLMRAAGVPARVVTGYQGGYWNKLGQYLLVRQSDAHAWSEVWLAGRGWVRVDPTAAVRPERVSLGAAAVAASQTGWQGLNWLQDIRNRWDVVNRWWSEGVIGFDALRQRGLLTPFGVRDTDTTTLSVLLAIGSVLFAALGLAWALWRRHDTDPMRAAMQALERKLARAGIARRSSEGPQHYLLRAARALPTQRAELDQLMRSYLDLRYAYTDPPPESVRGFKQAVRDFRPRHVVK